jgi:hypothetical protein
MKAFVVAINGQRICTAGVGTDGVLSVIANWFGNASRGDPGGFMLSASGLDSSAGEHVTWDTPAIGLGDVVTVELVEVEDVDPPSDRHPECPPPGGTPPWADAEPGSAAVGGA